MIFLLTKYKLYHRKLNIVVEHKYCKRKSIIRLEVFRYRYDKKAAEHCLVNGDSVRGRTEENTRLLLVLRHESDGNEYLFEPIVERTEVVALPGATLPSKNGNFVFA